MKKKVDFRHAIAMNLRGVRELHRVQKSYFPLLTVKCIFEAVSPYITVFFSAQILKELAGLRREEVLWNWVIAGTICICVLAIINAFLKQRHETLLNDLWGRKEILFIHKMFSLDFSELDKQENHDLRAQIKQNENWASWGLMRSQRAYERFVTGMIGMISGITLTVTLFTSPVPKTAGRLVILNNPIFILIFAAVMVGISVFSGKLSGIAQKSWSNYADFATLGNRLFGHFGFIGLDKKRSVDIRMNDQQGLVAAYWDGNSVFGVDGPLGKMFMGKMGIYSSMGVCMTVLITGFVYVFTCLKAWAGAFDVGSVTQYVGAATAMIANIFAFTELISLMETNTSYLDKTFEFLDIPNAMYQGSLTTEKRSDRNYEIEFKDVSFKYPGSDVWSLRHVNMKFKVGQRLAIVGENGSGKTTFIKLLCRLYDPQEGQILLNGIDIRKYKYDDYMDIFSIVFQDFQLICQPIGANVAGNAVYDRDRAYKALVDAGFGERLESLEKGLDTMIYKDLSDDGIDVSGGEAQKIAIARALYKDAPFIILDEPTAALDPIAEAEIYSKFDDISGDKTAIYISHRLSSCKFCDEIAVFDKGQVIQKGTHEKLLEDHAGKYYELWNAQAQYYVEEV
ncbi:ABC transporter ATP-binding protein [Butyrivibrio sp.]|uniref:ABC transporter ATP-binding protein n=1 Tax=Butyrivibrio sp. TaxID=28121 RepID=UPI0025B972B2|nr:ABC transporter ATP-binding protein [Butyrivibrio sp.]